MAAKNSSANSETKKYIRYTWMLVFGPIVFMFLILTIIRLFGDLPSVEELQNPRSNLASVVYSADGKILGKYYSENRVNVKYKNLSKNMADALIATEDARFLDHSAIDGRGLIRAVVGKLTFRSNSGGASTITQQLAKNMFPRGKKSGVKTVLQKFKEWIIAIRLEKLYTKEEILAMYLNKFDFLNNAIGIHSASQIYFDTTPDKLTISQSALLVGMCKNPAYFNPASSNQKKVDRAYGRRNQVFIQMERYGFISENLKDSLTKTEMGLHFSKEDHNSGLAPYFREYLRDSFLKDWIAKHKKEDGSSYDIYKDGLRIFTTIDTRMQAHAEEAVNEHMKDLQKAFFKDCKQKKNAPFAWNVNKEEIERIMMRAIKDSERFRNNKEAGMSEKENIADFHKPEKMRVFSYNGDIDTTLTPFDSIKYYKTFLQTGFMAMEPATGYVKAWVGGINHTHFKYDHVKQGARQVGSTFKPFVYALAIQEGYSPCYKVANIKTCIETETGAQWCPENSSHEKEGSLVTLKFALAHSINYVTAYIMKQFGPQATINLVRRMGVTSDIPVVPAIALGVADISVFEMVGANNTFANKGTYIQPTYVTRIEDKNGKVLEEFIPNTEEIMNEEKAYVMTQLMRGVVQLGTGSRLRYKFGLNNPIAGKTGTTQNNSDGWFMGLTPDLVAGTWVGGEDRSVHFNSTDMGQGASMALPIWGKFFQKCYGDKNLKFSKGDFSKPANMGDIEMNCDAYDLEMEKSTQDDAQSGDGNFIIE